MSIIEEEEVPFGDEEDADDDDGVYLEADEITDTEDPEEEIFTDHGKGYKRAIKISMEDSE